MFVAGFVEGRRPGPGDLVVGVRDDGVRFGSSDVDDPQLIGHLDGTPVWAGSTGSSDVRPWHTVEPAEVAARAVYVVRWRRTHRFCGECGGPLEDCPGFPTRRCPRCTTLPYVARSLAPAVIVAITSGDRLLLARHSYGIAASMWALIAGMVEACETLEAAVAREVREEVGLEIISMSYVRSKGFSLDNPACLMAAFVARVAPDAEPRVDGDELVEARWFTRAEYGELPTDRVPPPYSVAHPLIEAWRMSA